MHKAELRIIYFAPQEALENVKKELEANGAKFENELQSRYLIKASFIKKLSKYFFNFRTS